MKIRKLLGDVAKIVEGEDIASLIYQGAEKSDQTANDCLQNLSTAYNAVFSDVSLNYLGLQTTYFSNQTKIDLNSLTPAFKKVVDVKDSRGESLPYAIRNGKLVTTQKDAVLTYEYLPENADVDDDFAHYGKAIGYRAFYYGIASEYCLIKGRIEESANWESKYRQAVEVKIDFKRRRLKAGKRWGL